MRQNLNDLQAFITVARTGSFTKAAGQLGIAQSALSYTIKKLEQRLALKLLIRTTRSLALTPAGEQLLNDIEPLVTGLEQKLTKLNNFRDSTKARGKLRINGTEYVMQYLLWHKFTSFMQIYPDIQLELTTDYALLDIVKERYDIGIRLGNLVAKDMIAMPVTEPLEMVTVASVNYLKQHGEPNSPQELAQHRCIGLRLPSHDKMMSWEYNTNSDLAAENYSNITPPFSLIVSHARLQVKAVNDDQGIAWLPKAMVINDITSKKLVQLLTAWEVSYPGYYIYYPTRSESLPLLNLFIEHMRQR